MTPRVPGRRVRTPRSAESEPAAGHMAARTAILACLATAAGPARAAARPPSIIFILSDDLGFGDYSASEPVHPEVKTKIAQDWPKLRANFRALIWIFSQSVGPSLASWANPVQFSFKLRALNIAPPEKG